MQHGGSPCIIFRVDGGEQLGMGHLFKTTILSAELKKRHPNAGIFFFIREDATGYSWLKKQNVTVQRIPKQIAFTSEPDWILKQVKAFSKFDGRVLYVTDILDLPLSYAKRFNASRVKHLTFENQKSRYIADATINAIVDGLKNRVSHKNGKVVFSGPCWRIFNRSYQSAEKNVKRDQILVSLGGGSDNNLSLELAKALSKLVPEKNIKIIVGPAQKSSAQTYSSRIRVQKALPSLANELSRSELLISAGGGTLYEAALMGVPVVALAKVKHQVRNIRFFEKAGSAVSAGILAPWNIERTAKIAAKLLINKKLLQKMKSAGPKIVDGKGTARVLAIIENLLQRENL